MAWRTVGGTWHAVGGSVPALGGEPDLIAQLFAQEQVGAAWDVGDPSRVFTDWDTQTLAGHDDPISDIADLSPNNAGMGSDISSEMPRLLIDGDLRKARFDGSDDVFWLWEPFQASSYFICYLMARTSLNTPSVVLGRGGTNNTRIQLLSSNDGVQVRHNGSANQVAMSLPTAGQDVWFYDELIYDAGEVSMWRTIGGTRTASSGNGTPLAAMAGPLETFGSSSGGGFLPADVVFALVIEGVPTQQLRDDLRGLVMGPVL